MGLIYMQYYTSPATH